MAKIITKQNRRNRVQFSMSPQLFQAHQRNLTLARNLGTLINFDDAFESWFRRQVDDVAKQLDQLVQSCVETATEHHESAGAITEEEDHGDH